VSHEPSDADAFRAAYRELLEELVRLAPSAQTGPPSWADALYGDPLRFPPELDQPELAAAKQHFVLMLSRVASANRDVYREIARSVLQDKFALRSAPPPPPPPPTQYAPAPSHSARPPAPPPRASRPGLGERVRSAFSALRREKTAPPAAAAPTAPHAESGGAREKTRTHVTIESPVESVGDAAGSGEHAPMYHGSRAKPPMHHADGGLLGVEPSPGGGEAAAAPPPPAEPEPPEQPETRYLNAKLADREADTPLELATSYVLEVSVDLQKIAGAGSGPMVAAPLLFEENEQVITLTVQVTSNDFDVSQDSLPLKLPRRGPSRGKARFDVTPKREGRCSLTVSAHKEGNFVMQLEITYSVGATHAAPESVAVLGRPLTAASNMSRRELGMTISPSAKGGYDCIVRGPTHTSVVLPVSEAEVADAIKVARDAMLSVVSQRDGATLVFQTGIAIDDASRDRALRTLAVAGADLFQRIFYGPAAGADVQNVGELLKKQATKPGNALDFQVVATRFPVPWGLLYFGDTAEGATIDPELFLGMRHVVEQIPLQTGMLVDDTVIDSGSPSLAVSVNVNADIDGGQLKLDGVARQLAYWDTCATSAGPHLTVAPRRTRAELLDALRDGARDQLMYLYCHAVTNAPEDPGGIRNAAFQLTGGERVTLGDLYRESPTTKPLPGNPLVFINACESAELRPEFYDGFIPYFMAKGARGVVGTECKTPAVFATEWALRFFPRFLNGEPLGDIFLDLRREFHEKHGNPLGLLYSLYCDADTRIQPGLTV
jgi:hypothetical protein